MMKKTICLLLALCCVFFLTGCAGRSIEEDKTPVPTLKPAEARFAAPDGTDCGSCPGAYSWKPRT